MARKKKDGTVKVQVPAWLDQDQVSALDRARSMLPDCPGRGPFMKRALMYYVARVLRGQPMA